VSKTLNEILASDLIIKSKCTSNLPVSSITSDSREIKKGSVFFDVRGHSSDGHSYIKNAVELGASAVVIDRPAHYDISDKTILVKNSRQALGTAASFFFNEPTKKISLIGITGTNGKTTSSFILENVLNSLGKTSGLIGTVYNKIANQILESELTTPGPLMLQSLFDQMVNAKCTHAIMEVSSIALDQYRTTGCHFSAGLFTNLTGDHLDYHLTMENYFQAKLRLFQEYQLPIGIFWKDDVFTERFMKEGKTKRMVTFSLHKGTADYCVTNAALSRQQTWAEVQTPRGKVQFDSPLIGTYNLLNCLGVLATLSELGEPETAIAHALSSAQGAPGRLERVMTGDKFPSVIVDYAHSDDALLNVLRALNELKGKSEGKIITVFGCGGDRDKSKRPRMAKVVSLLSDVTIVTSDNPRTEDPNSIIRDIEIGIEKNETQYHEQVDRKKAIELALSIANPEDCVLIAGKGHENYQIIGTVKSPFDDAEVVRGYYQQ